MKIINIPQLSPEWHESRKNTFNASECGLLFGCDPWTRKNSQQVLAQKKYHGATSFTNNAMREGTLKEPEIREKAELMFGMTFQPCVGAMDADERFRASFDGITLDGDVILEIKYSTDTFNKLIKGEIPKHYMLQVQHQLMVSGAEYCIFVAMNKETETIFHRNVYPDVDMQNEIIAKWIEFETTYKTAPKEDLKIARDDTEFEIVALKLRDIKAKIKELEAEEDEYKKLILDMAGGVECSGFGVTVYSTTKPAYDYKTMVSENNIDLSKYRKESTSWSVRVS